MAISAAAIWEVRTTATASNANGGFFVTGASGTPFNEQDAAQYNLTGCTSAGADAIILNANAAADMVGNGAHVISGTNATAGWYEIISVVVGVSITVDRNWGTGAVANGVVNIGGALSLGSSDDAVFESCEPGNIWYVKSGTYTLGGGVSIAKQATATAPIKVIGYNASRDDNPTGDDRPIFVQGANRFTYGNYWQAYNMRHTSTTDFTMLSNSFGFFYNCKAINTSTTAARSALYIANGHQAHNCEAISYRGYGVYFGGFGSIHSCYVHDSDVGAYIPANYKTGLYNCIIARNVTYALQVAAGTAYDNTMLNCTLYGRSAKQGIGINFGTGAAFFKILNSIITGFTTGINHADANAKATKVLHNNFYNNTTDVTNVEKDTGNTAVDPAFAAVSEISLTTASTSNVGNTLTKAGATFVTSGVTPGRDFVYIIATSGTIGIYGIVSVDSETQLTLDLAPGTSSGDVTASVGLGANFATGAGVANAAFPGVFPGSYTQSYLDQGAVQRKPATVATGIMI